MEVDFLVMSSMWGWTIQVAALWDGRLSYTGHVQNGTALLAFGSLGPGAPHGAVEELHWGHASYKASKYSHH